MEWRSSKTLQKRKMDAYHFKDDINVETSNRRSKSKGIKCPQWLNIYSDRLFLPWESGYISGKCPLLTFTECFINNRMILGSELSGRGWSSKTEHGRKNWYKLRAVLPSKVTERYHNFTSGWRVGTSTDPLKNKFGVRPRISLYCGTTSGARFRVGGIQLPMCAFSKRLFLEEKAAYGIIGTEKLKYDD